MKYSDHIQYIIDNYSNQLLSRLREEGRWIPVEDALDIFLACDPTPTKKLVDWLVKTYIDEGFRWEDIEAGAESKLAEVLGLYKTHFSQIPGEQRNIYQYRSYGELYTLVKPYIPQEKIDDPGSREIKRRERARALEESEVLYRSSDMIVAVPLTENAAIWWGRGTKWCTAANKNNYFDHYNEKAPLIIITLMNSCSLMNQTADSSIMNPDSALKNQSFDSSRKNESSMLNKSSTGGVEKYQLWTHADDIQFMDATDTNVSMETVKKNWHFFEPILKQMVKRNGMAVRYIPAELLTEDICRSAVKTQANALYYVPRKFKTAEVCRLAVKQSGKAIRFVPEYLKTPEMLKLAIQETGNALQHILQKEITPELCLIAVQQNGSALQYVPIDMRNNDLYRRAVEQNGSALQHIPTEFITEELCRIAVEHCGYALGYVPFDMRTPEICRLAVEQNGIALYYLTESMKTPEICRRAVSNNGISIGYVPHYLKTAELCRIAVEKSGEALEGVPERFKTVEICRIAVEQNKNAIYFVPQSIKANKLSDIVKSKSVDWNLSDLTDIIDCLKDFENEKNSANKLGFTKV